MKTTGERLIPEEIESLKDYLLYLRHLFAYHIATKFINKDDKVLEVGAGEGYGTYLLSKSVKQITGIDVDKNVIEKAKEKYKNSKINFQIYDGKRLPFPDNSFDVVISFQVIEHIKEDSLFIKEIKRVVNKNGTFLLTTPNREYRLIEGEKPWNRFHVREYSVEMLKNLLSLHFSKIKIYGINAIKEIKEKELKRASKNRKLAQADILNLRYLLPENFSIKLAKFLVRKKPIDKKFSLSDYFLTKNPENGLDLFGVCKK